MSILRPCTILFASIVGCWLAAPMLAQDNASAVEGFELKVYPVADLVQPIPNFPFRSGMPTVGTKQYWTRSTTPSVGGGGGGGGFFSVADNIALAGAAAVGQTPVEAGGGAVSRAHELADGASPRFTINELRASIIATVTPDQWDETSGGPAVCQILGTMLLIKQTPAAHEQIDQLLAAVRQDGGLTRPITIDALWLTLDEKQLATLKQSQSGVPSVDEAVANRLAEEVASYRGRITCFSDQVVHLVSGERRTLSVGAVPTVGFSAVAYQPVTQVPNLGLLLETRTSLIPQSDSALVHLASTLTSWHEDTKPLVGSGIMIPNSDSTQQGGTGGGAGAASFAPGKVGQPTSPNQAAGAPRALSLEPGSVSIAGVIAASLDRVRIGTHEMVTSVRLPLGKPTLVGGLSLSSGEMKAPDDEGGPPKQIYLILKVSAADS